MTGSYDLQLIIASYLIAVFASYTALDLAGRVASSRGGARIIWLLGGAVSLGIGIWSMHFTGMLAFSLPIPVTYDIPLALLSLVAAIAASGAAFYSVGRPIFSLRALIGGGLAMAAGIVGMHYIGMAGMRMQAYVVYQPAVVALSVLIAIVAAIAALWLAFKFRSEASQGHWRLKVASALVMGVAISGMHYTGMYAAHFHITTTYIPQTATIARMPLATAIILATITMLGFTLLAALFDRRFSAQALAMLEGAKRFESLFQYNSDLIFSYDLAGRLVDLNTTVLVRLGLSRDTLLQQGLAAYMSASDARRFEQSVRETLLGQTQQYEICMQVAQQSMLLSVRTVPILIEERVVGLFVIASDITERFQAIQAHQQNELALRGLVEEQQRLITTVRQLSTPVLPVSDGALLLPLIGHIDTSRSEQMMEILLKQVEQQHARVVIIDITGVSAIDTQIAGQLIHVATALRLLGAELVLVGITPEVAQTIVGLGLNLAMLNTRGSLHEGIRYAYERHKQANQIRIAA
jgi:anti-anti-sigma factor